MSKLAACQVTYCYDGSFEGFLSVVFHAYAHRCRPANICPADAVQLGLTSSVEDVPLDMGHAGRVRAGICSHAGQRVWRKVLVAFLADEEGKEMLLFSYIEHALDLGPGILSDVACESVAPVERLWNKVLNERERMYQFLRFEKLQNGAFLARINPCADVVPIMMHHFVERFGSRPFLIYDEVHKTAGAWDGAKCSFARLEDADSPARSDEERDLQRLWKCFYDAVSHEQRYSPDLRRSYMPKRLWRNITELKLAADIS